MRSFYKIIHTSAGSGWGETERRILTEAVWMENQGHLPVIAAPLKSPLFQKARARGIVTYPLSFQTLAQVGEYGQLKQIFENEQPFVVNAHSREDARLALKAAQKTGVPCRIITRHSGGRLKNTWPNRNLYKKLSHYVFTTGQDTARHVQSVFGLSEMEVFSIPDSIRPPSSLVPKDRARKDLARHFGLAPETRFIGVLCGNADKRHLKTVLDAFTLLGKSHPHHLVVAGAAGKKGNASDLFQKEKSRIHLSTSAIPDWHVYRGLDCSIQIPGQDDFAGVPTEMIKAMYCSCPVVGGEATGIRDLLVHEQTGLVFDPASPESLAGAVSTSLNEDGAALERTYTARNRVKKLYTADAMGRDIIRIYRLHQVKLERRLLPGSF